MHGHFFDLFACWYVRFCLHCILICFRPLLWILKCAPSLHCNTPNCSQAVRKFPKVSKRNSSVHAGCDCNVRSALGGSSESGRGQPHSKTLARATQPGCLREVLECGCPLPLSSLRTLAKNLPASLHLLSSLAGALPLRALRAS